MKGLPMYVCSYSHWLLILYGYVRTVWLKDNLMIMREFPGVNTCLQVKLICNWAGLGFLS